MLPKILSLIMIFVLPAVCLAHDHAEKNDEDHRFWYTIGACLIFFFLVYMCWCLLTSPFFYDPLPSYSVRDTPSPASPRVVHVIIEPSLAKSPPATQSAGYNAAA